MEAVAFFSLQLLEYRAVWAQHPLELSNNIDANIYWRARVLRFYAGGDRTSCEIAKYETVASEKWLSIPPVFGIFC